MFCSTSTAPATSMLRFSPSGSTGHCTKKAFGRDSREAPSGSTEHCAIKACMYVKIINYHLNSNHYFIYKINDFICKIDYFIYKINDFIFKINYLCT